MRLIILAIAACLALATRAPDAQAYPQFQFATGNDRCIACHVSPAGGGLLNDYGRDESASISRGGDGRFLHGLWEPPDWLQLGLDLRGVGAIKYRALEDKGERELLGFPMQTDIYTRVGGERFSFNLTVGLRGGARDPQPPLVERIVSREHYLMYTRESGTYLRAGRFFPIFGIRSQDHTAYVRRDLGFHTLEEPYGIGAGMYDDDNDSELHVTAFVPRPIEFLGAGTKAVGVTGYYEKRFLKGDAAIAPQFRFADSEIDRRVTLGLVGKRYFPDAKVLLLAELDLQRQSFAADPGPTRYQIAAYAGASKFITRGLLLGAALQRWQPDLRLRATRDAFEINVQYFVRAHFELHLLTRVSGQGDFEAPGLLSFFQLHYYL